MKKCPYGIDKCPPNIQWPDTAIVGFSGVRYASITNPWIDFVVLFDDSQYTANTIAECVSDAMELYWDEDDDELKSYGDSVYYNLDEWGIQHFMILFHDSLDESGEYENLWEKWVSQMNIVKTLNELTAQRCQ